MPDKPIKKFLGWRIWYDTGEIYSSGESKWEELPYDGILVKMLYYEGGGKQIQQGVDYYYVAKHHSGEEIHGCGMDKDRIPERYPSAIIKYGRWAPDQFYRGVVNAAMRSIWENK